jgi:hypothetical protein
MLRRRTNNYFTNPARMELPPVAASSFEELVKALGLSPEQYASSAELKAWVMDNKDEKYVPPELLRSFGLAVEA